MPRRWTKRFYRRQRELMKQPVVAENDVVITTAAVPGRKAPTLVTAEMVAAMALGSVIVDAAAERGGNCELTQPRRNGGERRRDDSRADKSACRATDHASQMLSANITAVAKLLLKRWAHLRSNLDDEIIREIAGHACRARWLIRVLRSCSTGRSADRQESGVRGMLHDESDEHFESVYFHAGRIPGLSIDHARIPPLLHTPLMSLTNAISAIAVVGAILITGASRTLRPFTRALGFHCRVGFHHQRGERIPDHGPNVEDVQAAGVTVR